MGAGGRGTSMNSSRETFLAGEAIDPDIVYPRSGCFVSLRKGLLIGLLLLALFCIAGTVSFYYGTLQINKNAVNETDELEILLNSSLKSQISKRLPTNIVPLQYRLKIHPLLNEGNASSFTFSGHVTIVIQAQLATKFIVLNAENLHIKENQVTVTTTEPNYHRQKKRAIANESRNDSTTTSSPETKSNVDNATAVTANTSSVQNANISSSKKITKLLPVNSSTDTMTTVSSNNVSTTSATKEVNVVTEIPKDITSAKTEKSSVVETSTIKIKLRDLNSTSTETPTLSSSEVTASTVVTTTDINDNTQNSTENDSEDNNVKIVPSNAVPNTSTFREQIVRHDVDHAHSRYTIDLLYSLEPNINYTVDIPFTGVISEDFLGLFKTFYETPEGQQRWLIATNFQTIYARRMFPCFDEPSFKAPFDIIIGRRTNMTALSNMPLIRTETMYTNPGWVWDYFQTSPPMSTFAVAFTVMDYESVTITNSSLGTSLKVWAPAHEIENARYALNITYEVLKYFEEYIGNPFPLPKLDMVATPHVDDAVSENWGLILLNYIDILVNTSESKLSPRKNNEVALNLVCAALPHQWIGDLVTMPWWSDAWLKESFAQLMSRVGVNVVEPDWKPLERYSSQVIRNVLLGDSLKTTRNVYTNLDDPIEYEVVMDSIVGGKGGALLRMLKYTLLDTVYRRGIKNFIEKWKYKNVVATELWDEFDESAQALNSTLPYDISVRALMNSWTLQPGYPVVQVTRDYSTGSVTIEQQIFTEKNETDNSLWYIPLNYATSETKDIHEAVAPTIWLKHEKKMVLNNFTAPGNGSWLIFNVFQIGLYRVNYDATNWKLLQKMIEENPTQIFPINRAQIIDDAFEMAKLSYLDYNVPLELTKLLHLKERSPLTWSALFRAFLDLRDMLGSTPYNGLLEEYFLSIIQPVYKELGTKEDPKDSEDIKYLRTIVINHACLFNYQPCLDWALDQFKILSNNATNDTYDEPHKYAVQCMAIEIAGEPEWDIVWEKTKNSSRSDLETNYMSLGCARDAWLINRYLERTLDGSVPHHYVSTVWKSLTFESRDVGFKFLRTNWKKIYNTFINKPIILKSIIESMSQLSTEVDLADVTSFYKSNSVDLNNFSSQMWDVVDRIKLKIEWTNTRMKDVVAWLEKNYSQ